MCLLTWIIELLTEPYIYILEVLKLKSYETFHNLTKHVLYKMFVWKRFIHIRIACTLNCFFIIGFETINYFWLIKKINMLYLFENYNMIFVITLVEYL